MAATEKAQPAKNTASGISIVTMQQFMFDLCISWCDQQLDLEAFLFFLCALFMNITTKEQLKQLDNVSMVNEKFFSILLGLRNKVASKNVDHLEAWIEWNTVRLPIIKENLTKYLLDLFPAEARRVPDIIKHIFINAKEDKEIHQEAPSQKKINETKMEAPISSDLPDHPFDKFEKNVLDTLGNDYKHSKIQELSQNSILIETKIRLPIIGKKCEINENHEKEYSQIGEEKNIIMDYNKNITKEEKPTNIENIQDSIETKIRPRIQSVNKIGTSRLLRDQTPNDKVTSIYKKIIEKAYMIHPVENTFSKIKNKFDAHALHQRICKVPIDEASGRVNTLRHKFIKPSHTNQTQIQQPTDPKVCLSNSVLLKNITLSNDNEASTLLNNRGSVDNKVENPKLQKIADYQFLLSEEHIKAIENGHINLDDPIEFAWLIQFLTKCFNDKYRSEFLDAMEYNLPYVSKRHEMGGAITNEQWNDYMCKLSKVLARGKRRRRNLIKRRKRKGITLYPRKAVYAPPKCPKLEKNPLWNEVFSTDRSTVASQSSLK